MWPAACIPSPLHAPRRPSIRRQAPIPARSVTISTTTGGATIRYTTDGTTPTETVGTVYSSPVSLSKTCTLKAIAYKSGKTDSSVTSGTYTLYIGYNVDGGTSLYITPQLIRGSRFQAAANLTVNNINVLFNVSVTGNIKCAIYADGGGYPSTCLMGTNVLNNPGTGWKTFNLTSSQALTSGTYYWLVFWSDSDYALEQNASTGTSFFYNVTYRSTWPTLTASVNPQTLTWSMYAY